MAKWDPPNQSYKEPGPSQYNPTIIDKPCPYDGGVVVRIGSSSYDARCVQCSRQFYYNNLRGLVVLARGPFPVIPLYPGETVGTPAARYEQPGTAAPAPHPDVASYPLKPVNSIAAPTSNYQQPDYRVPETDPQVGSHYGGLRPPQ